MKVTSRKKYSMDFKLFAVEKSINSPYTVNSVAKELGIAPKMLTRWRTELSNSSPNKDQESKATGPEKSYAELERENKALKKRLARAELEADILKKAKEYFDKHGK